MEVTFEIHGKDYTIDEMIKIQEQAEFGRRWNEKKEQNKHDLSKL